MASVQSSLSSSSSLSDAKEIVKGNASSQESHFSSKTTQEEVFAAQTMRHLTARFGTRGKSAKSIFLQGFRDELLGKGKRHPHSKNIKQIEKQEAGKPKDKQLISVTHLGLQVQSDGSRGLNRPAAMVLYSKFCKRLEILIKNQVFHLGLVPPTVETTWLYDEARQDSFKVEGDTGVEETSFEIIGVDELLDETEEKMILRLKVYKRAMSALILHCEALRPLLREIKRSYDSVLKLRERQLMEISWTSQNIITAEKEVQEKIQSVGFEGFEIIRLMESQCKHLMQHIDKQDSAIRLMTDILNTLENALGDEHELRRDSDDQNKMFIKDINDIRRKLGMPPRVEETGESFAVEEVKPNVTENTDFSYTPDDPLILRKALDISRHDLSLANKRLEQLEEEHKDEIPRHQSQQLQRDLEALNVEHEELKEKFAETQSQVQGIKDQVDKLTADRDDLKKHAGELRVKMTPRPSWEKIGEFVEGGVPKWKSMYEGKSSVEVSNKVIEQLNSKKTASPPEYLTALGDDPSIPRCLRHDTRVRDRRMTRRDAEVIIQDIWKSRLKNLEEVIKMKETALPTSLDGFDSTVEEVPLITSFPEYVAHYFEDRFPVVARRMEWTYNLVDACKRLTMNHTLSQFLGILMSTIDEGCYHLLRSELARFHQILHNRSSELGYTDGLMTLGDFIQLLGQVYPHKSEEEIKSLLRVTTKQSKAHADWTLLKYDILFSETDEGYEGEFYEEFTKQLEQDRMKYVHEIIRGLLLDLGVPYDYEQREEDSAGDTDVHMRQFYKTLIAVDPQISDQSIGAALAWVYMRISILPGIGPRGVLLANYLKTRLNSGDVSDHADELEYKKAIDEIKDGFNVEADLTNTSKQSKTSTQQTKIIKLRVLCRRMKEGAFVRRGTKLQARPLAGGKIRYEGEIAGEYDEYDDYNEEYEEEMEEEEQPSALS